MPLPRRADSVNYFLLGSAAIICIFHLAVGDVAGGREESRHLAHFHFVSPQLLDGGAGLADRVCADLEPNSAASISRRRLSVIMSHISSGYHTKGQETSFGCVKTSITASFIPNWLRERLAARTGGRKSPF